LTAVVIVALNPLLGALVLVVVPLFAICYVLLRKRLASTSFEYQNLRGEVESVAQENLSAHAVVKAFSLEERAVAAFRARLTALFRMDLRLTMLGGLFEISMSLAITLGELLVLGVGGYLVMEGELTVGTLLAFIGLLGSLFQPIAMLSNLGQTLQRASGALDRVAELLDEPAAIADRPAAVPLPPLEREIRLEHLTFGYSRDRPVLFDLSLAIPAGSRAAIVGPSGAGKTTIVNLLMRFWDPDQGRVLFDDHDLRDVTVASLRGQIGLVFQDTFVFDTTVRENIAMGRPGATDAEIAAAAEAAEIDAYITSLPAGYDAILGERGVRMSSGQRQRLAIAQALLRDPRILLLDEATSALDTRTEREILDTLAVLERGRTTIMVTHRLSLAATADRIFVLDKGRVVEHGSHADLVAAGGLYRRLHEEQTGYATDAAGECRARPGPPRGPTA
jgi:ABC-type multidrug transport system fused ATPase/permease subunit